jgi:hypothetical protein
MKVQVEGEASDRIEAFEQCLLQCLAVSLQCACGAAFVRVSVRHMERLPDLWAQAWRRGLLKVRACMAARKGADPSDSAA